MPFRFKILPFVILYSLVKIWSGSAWSIASVIRFEVPFILRYTHFFDHELKSLVMCDYASAGNEYSTDNLFRTWLPQPMFMGNLFPENTWRILHRESDKRPVFPDIETQTESESAWNKAN